MRLIDADALCRRVGAVYTIAQGCGAPETAVFYKALQEEVEQMETIDAVEVVRCKDCKFFHEYEDGETYCEWLDLIDFPLDGFCSEGESIADD